MNLISKIERAFAERKPPVQVVNDGHPPTEIYADAMAFHGKTWLDLTVQDLEKHSDAVYGFTPQAFCYYLPGIFLTGLRENRPDLLVNHALIVTLDRGNAPLSWDDFFSVRWPTLNVNECAASQEWILWLADANPPVASDTSLSRAYDTLAIIGNKDSAIPLAGWISRTK
jgi:hypothetical protein